MPAFHRLLNLVLALALLAGGMAPAHAHEGMDAMPTGAVLADPPCHEGDGGPAVPEPADAGCCDPADCGCDCLQHPPSQWHRPVALAGPPAGRAWSTTVPAPLPRAPTGLPTRPPIT